MPNLNGGNLLVTFENAAPEIRNADQLQFRGGRGVISTFIRTYGGSPHTHSAKAAWWESTLMCLEVRELRGGRAVTLESQVKKFPGQIDVFRSNAMRLPETSAYEAKLQGLERGDYYDRQRAMQLMLSMAGCEYGYGEVALAALTHLPIVRICCQPNFNDEAIRERPPFCSAACTIADRIGGGVDPVPHLADAYTEPGHLTHSTFYKYLFTLVP